MGTLQKHATGQVLPATLGSENYMALLPATLRGLGQIMLQRNAATGLLFVLGIAVNSITMAVAALLGSIGGTALASLAGFPPDEIEDGLYGFNGALVAIAAMLFYSFSFVGVLIAAGGVALATILMRVMQKHSLKPFTFPFIVITWAALLLVPHPGGVATSALQTKIVAVDGFLQAFGQVMFQANSLTGLVFMAALLVSSKKSAVLAALGAALGVATGIVSGWQADQVTAGVYGYNAVLAAIAAPLVAQAVFSPVAAVLMSIVITKAMLVAGLPALTFPFVLSVWVVALWRWARNSGAVKNAL